jgi:hypothetical protein
VWVLSRFRQGNDVDLVSANFARKRAKIGKGGNDIELRLRCESASKDREHNKKDFFHDLEFVSTVCAENEFELKKDRIDIAIGEKKVFVEKVMIVLQTDL